MTTLKVYEKINTNGKPIEYGRTLVINADILRNLVGGTKSMYVRSGKWLSRRGHGSGGAGDICSLDSNGEICVNSGLYSRIHIIAAKAGSIINTEE
jgi:hypothetical protein